MPHYKVDNMDGQWTYLNRQWTNLDGQWTIPKHSDLDQPGKYM